MPALLGSTSMMTTAAFVPSIFSVTTMSRLRRPIFGQPWNSILSVIGFSLDPGLEAV